MRTSSKLPVIPDLLSLLAIVALVSVVYLCSLPQSFHSLSNRKAEAVALLASARSHIDREGALFTALLAAGDPRSEDGVRESLLDNERHFHDLTVEATGKLPEARRAIEEMVINFDRLAATGWQAEAALKQNAPAEAQSLLQTRFFPDLSRLRDNALAIEETLHRDDTRLTVPNRTAG